jgi:AmmeMemoRadiSam system protein A
LGGHRVSEQASWLILDLFNNPVGCCWTKVRQVSQMWRISCKNPPHLLFFSGSCSITEVIEQLYLTLCILFRRAYTGSMELAVDPEEQRALLADARESIAARLEGRRSEYRRGPVLAERTAAGESALGKPCGAFVTLHIATPEGKKLRGCIGSMTAAQPLEAAVRTMALEAAFGDPRFPPLSAAEFPRCTIEISALSPMEVCADPRSVRVGVHGLYLSSRGRSGVLLPQVPVEQGWNLDEYLDYICVKAGLPPRSYEEKGARLFTFTAKVFGEDG